MSKIEKAAAILAVVFVASFCVGFASYKILEVLN